MGENRDRAEIVGGEHLHARESSERNRLHAQTTQNRDLRRCTPDYD